MATIADLYRVTGPAELVHGQILLIPLSTAGHGRVRGRIIASLLSFETQIGRGCAVGGHVGFIVDLPHRQSFSPDAAYFFGPYNEDEFIDGAPAFAAEVRSPEDFGPVAGSELAAKRADYFAAGTQVVWDVDMIRDKVIRVYRATAPDQPTIYGVGEVAKAEPALPDWKLAVAELLH